MSKANIKKDDIVVVLAGSDKGKKGKVLRVDRKAGRVTVEGVNVQKKTMRRSQERPQGGIMDVEGPIDISNVMEETRYNARPQIAKAKQS
jgi:large subunit ribosomal protein L24